jgi:putative tryptophan/tyrosine transport system substrate-binding protein
VIVATDYDPLAHGYVTSLARPSGNITGVFPQQIELAKKRLQIFKEALPDLQTATMFWDASSEDQWKAMSAAAGGFGLRLVGVELLGERPYDYEAALMQAPLDHRGALITPTSPAFYRDRAWRSLLFGTELRRSSAFAYGSKRVACYPTAQTSPRCSDALQTMWDVSQKEQSPPTCRSSSLLSSN